MWFSLAAGQGAENAEAGKSLAAKSLNAEQLNETNQLVMSWQSIN